MFQSKSQGHIWRTIFCSEEDGLFVLDGPSTDWARPTTLGRAICLLKIE